MSQVRRVGTGDLRALLSSDGSEVAIDADGYVSLGVGTYLVILGGIADASLESVQILTGSAIAFVGTVETCNFPAYKGGIGSGTVDVTDWDVTGSKWTQENPSTALVGSSGTGWSITALTLTKTAGVGSAMLHLGNVGCKRARLKLVVSIAGLVRFNAHGKS